MANIKQTKENTLAIIDAAIAILNKFPALDTTNVSLSVNTSLNPFDYLMDLFKSTAGYNTLLNILSKFIVYELPAVEIAVKGVLLSNLKNILTCSLNPFITDDILRDGIVFNLEEIDITDTLRFSPLSKIGKNYYFDIENCLIADDTKRSKDFNALLWYMKTRAVRREVWGKKSDTNDPNEDLGEEIDEKQKKSDGIITLEYNERSSSLLTSEGSGMNVQTPYNNCLHVFIGNTKELTSSEESAAIETKESSDEIVKMLKDVADRQATLLATYQTYRQNIQQKKIDNIIGESIYHQYYTKNNNICVALETLQDGIIKEFNVNGNDDEKLGVIKTQTNNISIYLDGIDNIETSELPSNIEYSLVTLAKALATIKNSATSNYKRVMAGKTESDYRDITKNYYYRHTLIEFNVDYVMSLQLFDAKVIAAQLLDQLTGLLSIDLNLSYKQMLIKNEVKKMVQMIVETDDAVVSDCFFSFSNEEYDQMLQKTDLQKAGLFTVNGEENSIKQINAEEILDKLNGINPNSSQETIQTIIEGTLTDISKEITRTDYLVTDDVNFGIQMNFIENLMNNLAYIIAMSVLSPKVYLLILINLELLGRDTNFNLEGFINQFKQLLVNIIREIRDRLIDYLVQELMKILGELAKEIAVKISIEQAAYYARLIKRIFDCIRRKGMRLDWDMDNVDYADIYNDETEEPKNKDC